MIVFSVTGVSKRSKVSVMPSSSGVYVVLGDVAFTIDDATLNELKYEIDSYVMITGMENENAEREA